MIGHKMISISYNHHLQEVTFQVRCWSYTNQSLQCETEIDKTVRSLIHNAMIHQEHTAQAHTIYQVFAF